MKKLFTAEYGDALAEKVSEWIKEKTIYESGECKVYEPKVVVILFDQNGEEITL